MLCVDTSAWIEWLVDGPLARDLAPMMPAREQCVVPTLVQHELSKWLHRTRGESEADEFIAYTQKCLIIPLDTTIALQAADLCHQYRLATADALIYATALSQDVNLMTCDAHFEGLPSVTYFKKIRE